MLKIHFLILLFILAKPNYSWEYIQNGDLTIDQQILKIHSSNGKLFAGTNKGIFIYQEQNWNKVLNDSIFDFADNDSSLLGLSSNGVNLSIDFGLSWEKINIDGFVGKWPRSIKCFKSTCLIIVDNSSQPTPLFISRDYGVTWNTIDISEPWDYEMFASGMLGDSIIVAHNFGLSVTLDTGKTFEPILQGAYILDLMVLNDTIIASGNGVDSTNGREFSCVYISVDGGKTWKINLSEINGFATNILIHNGRLYVNISGSIYVLDYLNFENSEWSNISPEQGLLSNITGIEVQDEFLFICSYNHGVYMKEILELPTTTTFISPVNFKGQYLGRYFLNGKKILNQSTLKSKFKIYIR